MDCGALLLLVTPREGRRPQAPANGGNLQRRAAVEFANLVIRWSRNAGSAKLASMAVRVTPTSSSSLRPKCSRAIAYSPPTLAPKYGGSSEPSVSGIPASRRTGKGCSAKLGKTPRTTLLVGHTSSVICRRASSATSAGSSIARTPWAIRVTRQLERAAHRVRAGPLAGVHRAARGPRRPRSRRPRRRARAGSRPRRRPARSRPRRGAAARRCARRSRSARSTPKLRTATLRMRASMPWSRRASSMPGGDALPVLGVAQAGQPRVVDRRGQLDVDRRRRRRRRRGTRRRRRGSPAPVRMTLAAML